MTTRPMTARSMHSSPYGQFAPWTASSIDSSPHGQLAPWAARPMHGQLAHRSLTQMTGHPMDNSPHGGLLDYFDDSTSEIVSHTPCM
jgi:hypothetical protein